VGPEAGTGVVVNGVGLYLRKYILDQGCTNISRGSDVIRENVQSSRPCFVLNMALINFYFTVCSVYNVLYSREKKIYISGYASRVTLVPILIEPTSRYMKVMLGPQLIRLKIVVSN
jgi:hypothetical protein